MTATERDVRLRTTVTREGETDALRQLADDVKAAAGAATESEQAFVDFAAALDRLDAAQGLEEQAKALEEVKSSFQALKDTAVGTFEESSVAAAAYEQALAAIEERQRHLADPLIQQYDRAREAVQRFEEAAEKGTEEAATRGAEAAFQVSRLADELDRATAEGRDVGKIGDELRELGARADSATQNVVKLRVAKDQYNRTLAEGQQKVEGYGRGVASLDDILLNFRDRGHPFLQFLGRAGLAVGGATLVFREAYRAGRELADGIDFIAKEFFNVSNASDKAAGSINRWIGLTKLANTIAGEGGQLGLNQAKILDSQRAAFERLNIPLERYTDNVRRNQQAIADAARGNFEHAKSVEAVAKAYGLLTDAQLVDRARQLTRDLSDLLKAGFDREDIAAAAKAAVQAVLAEVDRLPPGVRSNLELAAKYVGILAPEHEAAAEAAEEHAERAATAAKRLAAEERAALEERRKELRSIGDEFERLYDRLDRRPSSGSDARTGLQQDLEALEREKRELENQVVLEPEDLGRLDALSQRISELRQQVQEAGADAQQWGEDSRSASEAVDAAIAGVIDSLSSQYATLTAGQQQAIENLLARLQSLGQSGAATGQDVANSLRQIIGVLESTGAPADALHQSLERIEGRGLDVGRAFEELRARVVDAGAEIESAGARVEAAGQAVAQGAATAAAGSVELERVGKQWQVVGDEVEKGSISIRRAGEDVDATSLRVRAAGDAASEAGQKFGQLGADAQAAGERAQDARPSFEEWAKEAGRLKTEIESGSITIKRHRDETEASAAAAKETAAATGEAAESAGRLAKGSSEVAQKVREQADASKEAATATRDLATASEEASTSQASAARSAGELAGEAKTAASELAGVAESLDKIRGIDLSAAVAQIRSVAEAVEETAARVEMAAGRINAAFAVESATAAPPQEPS